MCVLQPCANPTLLGVWWRDDTKWCRYGQEHDVKIRAGVANGLSSVDLGTITSSVHPKGARYASDLKNMEQVAVSYGQRRPIKIIHGPSAQETFQISRPPQLALEAPPSRGNASARVHYRDSSGNLVEYLLDVSSALSQVCVRGKHRSLVLRSERSGVKLHFDLDTVEQCVVEGYSASGETILSDEAPRKVINEVPWDPETMLHLVRKSEGSIRRKILVMTVKRIRSDEHMDATFPERARPKTVVSRTADVQSSPGDRWYEEFVSALESSLFACPRGIESFLKLIVPGKNSQNSSVQMIFKPVERKKGANSTSKANKVAFWMSMAAPIAAVHAVAHGSAVLQIMACLVILPATLGSKESKAFNTCRHDAEVMIGPDHCLPLTLLGVR